MNWPVFIVFDNHNFLTHILWYSPSQEGKDSYVNFQHFFGGSVEKECKRMSHHFLMVCSTYLERFPPSSALSSWAPPAPAPPLFVAAFLPANHFFSPTLRTTPENLGCVHFLLHMIHMLTGDFFRWGISIAYRMEMLQKFPAVFGIILWIILNFKEMKKYPGPGLHWKFCFSCKFCFSSSQDIHALYASASPERAHYSTLSVYKVRGMRNISKNNL